MADLDRDDRSRVRLRVVSGLVAGALALAALGFGIWGFKTKAIGAHVTDCHFDAQGAYARIRVNNLLGSSAHRKVVYVDFYAASSHGAPVSPYATTAWADMTVPAHGHGTGVIHGRFPLRSDKVAGRTIYVLADDYQVIVSKRFARNNPHEVRAETVPDDPSWLRCSIAQVTESAH